MTIFWVFVFIASLAAVTKGADWFLVSAERVGIAMGLSPFIIGVLIVGLGTSLPELASSIAAAISGATEIVAANAVGSNITNILLVIGISAVLARTLVVTKDLIDLDLPLLAIVTGLFVAVAWDGEISRIEALILLAAYVVYLLSSVYHKDHWQGEVVDFIPERAPEYLLFGKLAKKSKEALKKINALDLAVLAGGLILLVGGAKFLVDSVVTLAAIFSIGTGVITLAAVALGTSLPELLVSARAAMLGKSEVAVGNIFGSNVFNLLVVVGLPGLISPLAVDQATMFIAIPTLIITTLLFIFTGISKHIHMWEGMMFLLIYIFFIGKLFFLF